MTPEAKYGWIEEAAWWKTGGKRGRKHIFYERI
jgi:hypothetical protein